MKVTIKTATIMFELDEPQLKISNYFGHADNQVSIDYLKQLIEKVSIESQKLSNQLFHEPT